MAASVGLLSLPPLDIVAEPLRGRYTVHVRIACVGSEAEGERLVAPLRQLGSTVIDGVGKMPYSQVGQIHADPPVPMPIHEGSLRLSELSESAVAASLQSAAARRPAVRSPW